MVWTGICATGKTPLVFADEGVKIDQNVYRRDILDAVVVPWTHRRFGRQQCTLQQDSAPAHKAKATQEWCNTYFHDFHIFGMAALLAGSQPNGLQHLVNFGSQGLC